MHDLTHKNVRFQVFAPMERNIHVFVVSVHPKRNNMDASKGKQKDQRTSCGSIQTTLNIKATQLQKGTTDCTRVTSACGLASHWAAVPCCSDRGQYYPNPGRGGEETAADGGICSGFLFCLNFDWWHWFLCCTTRHMAPFPNQIIVRKFNLTEQSKAGAG